MVIFFLEWVTYHTTKSPTQSLGRKYISPFRVTPALSRFNILNLHILQIGDTQATSINSGMPIRNLNRMLVDWLSQDQQNWARGIMFVD